LGRHRSPGRGTSGCRTPLCCQPPTLMNLLLDLTLPVAAIGYSLLYMLFGGGILGAIVIFIIAKLFRK